jgi:ABC-type spermidine/putrescine transport system permease subunit II
MDLQALATLEESSEPYRRAGFVVTSQTEGSITLTLPPEKFSYVIFIVTLILVWPVAVLYLVSFNNQRGRSVCLRLTSQGYVEASGYTLGAIERERKRRRFVAILALCVCALIVLLIVVRVYLARAR